MKTKIINISIPNQLLSDVDQVAKNEYRTRSELFREAVRSYILARKELSDLYVYGSNQAKTQKITPKNLNHEILNFRKNK